MKLPVSVAFAALVGMAAATAISPIRRRSDWQKKNMWFNLQAEGELSSKGPIDDQVGWHESRKGDPKSTIFAHFKDVTPDLPNLSSLSFNEGVTFELYLVPEGGTDGVYRLRLSPGDIGLDLETTLSEWTLYPSDSDPSFTGQEWIGPKGLDADKFFACVTDGDDMGIFYGPPLPYCSQNFRLQVVWVQQYLCYPYFMAQETVCLPGGPHETPDETPDEEPSPVPMIPVVSNSTTTAGPPASTKKPAGTISKPTVTTTTRIETKTICNTDASCTKSTVTHTETCTTSSVIPTDKPTQPEPSSTNLVTDGGSKPTATPEPTQPPAGNGTVTTPPITIDDEPIAGAAAANKARMLALVIAGAFAAMMF